MNNQHASGTVMVTSFDEFAEEYLDVKLSASEKATYDAIMDKCIICPAPSRRTLKRIYRKIGYWKFK